MSENENDEPETERVHGRLEEVLPHGTVVGAFIMLDDGTPHTVWGDHRMMWSALDGRAKGDGVTVMNPWKFAGGTALAWDEE
ncbi:MAG: hypothetical protein KGJ23_07935 [Euryarchaeota archaeon]|nr:hypothetical protein [Euryarchaeota archaeon]MDE1836530.1 hypothetical protein [Euryarchaeota archaeon]MDE1879275.1 hypothetical protein [Euryarchaeota archaeon]MDE2044500.1 hypothetical protein [Thermoplasmata archaeon]